MKEYEYDLLLQLANEGDRDAMRDIVEFMCNCPENMLSAENIDYAQCCLTVLAEEGDSRAMLLLGTRYYNGQLGFPQDFVLAREWYEKAAEHDDSWALCNLGYIYAYGRGVEADPQKALKYFVKSARMNNPNALYKIGDCYHYGELLEQDYDAAAYWYSKAQYYTKDENGVDDSGLDVYPNIMLRLGGCALHGHGQPEDPIKALAFLHRAEWNLYVQIHEGMHPFASETLKKVQSLLHETREALDKKYATAMSSIIDADA
jgi:TPR repeat protein